MCINIIHASRDVDTGAATAAYQFRRKNLSVCIRGHPEIAGHPHPFQEMLSIGLDAAPGRIVAGELAPIYEDMPLIFARRYLLSRRHAPYFDSEVKVPAQEKWVSYLSI